MKYFHVWDFRVPFSARIRQAAILPLLTVAGLSGPALAGTWSSGTGFTWLNPTTDKLGVGLNTTPAEKVQIAGGSVLIDNSRNY